MKFNYPEDRDFFADLLTDGDVKKFDKIFKDFFDFRSPEVKRKEFNLMRNQIFIELGKRDGYECRLNILKNCQKDKDLAVDHVIPISSNELNKKLRKIKGKDGKKTPTQSFGSNYIGNLILACSKCNNHKKHRFLDSKIMKKIFKLEEK